MTSKTSSSSKYRIQIGKATFTFIDTPGFGDTRGMQVDELQADNIRRTVLEEGGINCICVL